ncbi:beta-lactamase/transpeptidase-like protein [Talaromyces proteolyticus]|uniref:Beta-lactamase/transpeptidase-like protein n=1 Tax=Talaromyces proteolyticus TaxID=1131652 RepID=A0AAD4Q520_9EURO|nr:beta-lactamase/transpeptidase-like protein [Talaromyces proteolyticus]KAH8703836.1 beta-lactamase/transpeptidase-like protein [Talaromyces proteolyticus]
MGSTATDLADWDDLVLKALEKWKVPGMSVAVVHEGESWAKAYGVAELPDKPLSTDSLFQGCSTTKAFTAAATALVIDDESSNPSESQLKWDTPISSVIPDDFVLADPYATANTTFEDALSHRSGQPAHFMRLRFARTDESTQFAVRALRHMPLAYAPRTTFEYNNFMYIAVSHALEQRTREALGSFMKRRIWEPLGMRDTYFDVREVEKTPGLKERLVQGYDWFEEVGNYKAQPNVNYGPTKGAGSMVSTVLDYEKWVKALLAKSTPLSKDAHEALFRPRSIVSSEQFATSKPGAWAQLYALGWFVDSYQGIPFFWHTGGWPGTAILVGLVPSKNFGFVMMSNSSSASDMYKTLYTHLFKKYLNLPLSQDPDNSQTKPTEEKPQTSADAIQRFFKSLSLDEATPPSVPLSALTGTYSHPAYGSMTITLEDETLRADCMDRVLGAIVDLEHVTVNHFLAKSYLPGWGKATVDYFAAEFHIASSGRPDRLGIKLEPALEDMIWFDISSAVSAE